MNCNIKMINISFVLSLFVPFTILFHASSIAASGFNDSVTHVVQRTGKQSTFSCPLPPNDAWSKCTFDHYDHNDRYECSVFNRPAGSFQNCGGLANAELHVQDGVCQLVITSVANNHNGTWSCTFEEEKQKRQWDLPNGTKDIEYSRRLGTFAKDFSLTILQEPSSIEVRPNPGSVQSYYLLTWPRMTILMHNVAPKPKVQWTMDNQSIDGVSIKETNVNYMAQDWEVEEKIQFQFWESCNGKHLQYRLTLEVVDEFGNATEDWVDEGSIKMNCKDCHSTTPTVKPTTTDITTANPPTTITTQTTIKTTTTMTTLETTTSTTTTTATTTTATTTTTTTTTTTCTTTSATTTTTTTTTTPTTTTTTTTTPTTTTTSTTTTTTNTTTTTSTAVQTTNTPIMTSSSPSTPSTTTMEPIPTDCTFNMTDMSGPLYFPRPGARCNLQPSPSWTILINCDGNCINVINVNINSMESSGDPCETILKVTTASGDGDTELYFNATTPIELSFQDKQVTLELENYSEDSPVMFDGEYYFSE